MRVRSHFCASIERILGEVHDFDRLQRAAALTRCPRLGFSWTLMRDNVAEFPRFLRAVADLEPDLVYEHRAPGSNHPVPPREQALVRARRRLRESQVERASSSAASRAVSAGGGACSSL
jgi:hypothetical protein